MTYSKFFSYFLLMISSGYQEFKKSKKNERGGCIYIYNRKKTKNPVQGRSGFWSEHSIEPGSSKI